MIRVIGTYIVVNFIAVGLLIIFNGVWPRTITGWAMLFTLSLPIYIFEEYIGSKLFSGKISQTIDKSERIISGPRMAYALLIGIIYLVSMCIIYYLFKGFWHKHFLFH